MPKATHFKDLIIWQKSMLLTQSVYRLTARFPAEERYGLTNQLRRAAVSVPSNIAEGQARQGTREFLVFLSHASGSLAELETQLILSEQLGLANATEIDEALGLLQELQKMIAAMRHTLRTRL